MRNRERTFYKLTTNSNLINIYKIADSTNADMFYELGWWSKWGTDLRIYENNIAFLDRLEGFVSIADLKKEVNFQLKNIQHDITQKEWLEHTIFICKDRYNENKKETLVEVVKYCELFFKKEGGTKKRPYAMDIALFYYYTDKTNYKVVEKTYPVKHIWDELGTTFSKSKKNIQLSYNEIKFNAKKRVAKNKVNNIKYVVNSMLAEYPKALALAKDELKQAELK